MRKKKLISIVIPVFNEEAVIPELRKQLTKFVDKSKDYDFEIILVEHGSTDTSYQLLQKCAHKDKRFKILQLSRNFTADGGIAAGMQFAQGDALVVMMADLQEPLELVTNFIEKWQAGYDIVYGIVKKRTASPFRNLSSILFYKVLNLFTNNAFPESVSDFRLMDRRVYQAINKMPEKNKYLRGLVMWTGFKHTGIPFNRKKRYAGQSKATLSNVMSIAMNGIFSFSYLPLRMIAFIGIFITIISFVAIVIYLFLFFTEGRQTPGITTVILLLLFLFGMLFFALGITSEYMARIYEEVKGRPNFIVKNKVNLD